MKPWLEDAILVATRAEEGGAFADAVARFKDRTKALPPAPKPANRTWDKAYVDARAAWRKVYDQASEKVRRSFEREVDERLAEILGAPLQRARRVREAINSRYGRRFGFGIPGRR